MGMEEYKLEAHPVSKKEAIIQGDCYRITMLTSALVRLGIQQRRCIRGPCNTVRTEPRDFPGTGIQGR